MRFRQFILPAVMASMLVMGCARQDGASSETQGVAAAPAATQDVKLLGGKVNVRIPADLALAGERDGLAIYMNDNGGITFATGDSPGGDATALIAQTLDNMKRQDPGMKVLRNGEVKFGDHVGKTVEAQMKSGGKEVHMAMALAVLDDKLVSIQVIGAQSEGDAVAARAKAVFDSISVAD